MKTPIRSLIAAAAGSLLLAGCGPAGQGLIDSAAQPLRIGNGLSPNGLSANGLSANGLSANGLSANGLSANGLSTTEFKGWFNENPQFNDVVMSYVVRCAMAEGSSLTWTHTTTGVTYTWDGLLGVATRWASGQPIDASEKQTMTACLAAHVNKYGRSVNISVLGTSASGSVIPYTSSELRTYSEEEACFFGDLFSGDGVFVGSEFAALGTSWTTARACAIGSDVVGPSTECPPMYFVGDCFKACKHDSTRTYYTSCTWNGKSYRPFTTRMLPSDIYHCGDGVCQFTEACGTATACARDCGCP